MTHVEDLPTGAFRIRVQGKDAGLAVPEGDGLLQQRGKWSAYPLQARAYHGLDTREDAVSILEEWSERRRVARVRLGA